MTSPIVIQSTVASLLSHIRYHPSMAYIEIDKDAFFHNLNQLALKAGSKEKIALVLKDNAYGHGLAIMAELAARWGVREAVVKNLKEAFEVERLFDNTLVLGERPVAHERLSFAVSELSALEEADTKAAIELKIDTGMHRNGIAEEELDRALAIIRKRGLHLKGVMTHYRSADICTSEYYWQKKRFARLREYILSEGFHSVRFHSHNSAALLRCKSFDEDIARVGIAAYGYEELPDCFDRYGLKPVLSLYARRFSSKVLKRGERIGYGGDFTLAEDTKISTYDIGYGDGWRRGDSSNPYTTAEGLKILGRVSMDFISLPCDRESVCIMNDAAYAAKHFSTITYEILTSLKEHIPRYVV